MWILENVKLHVACIVHIKFLLDSAALEEMGKWKYLKDWVI